MQTTKKPTKTIKYIVAALCLAAFFAAGCLLGLSLNSSGADSPVEVRIFDGVVEYKTGGSWQPGGEAAQLVTLDPAYIARQSAAPAAPGFGGRLAIGGGSVQSKSSYTGGSSGSSGSTDSGSSGDGEDIWSGDIL